MISCNLPGGPEENQKGEWYGETVSQPKCKLGISQILLSEEACWVSPYQALLITFCVYSHGTKLDVILFNIPGIF
jgi:hypothetical protein